ncbi:DUF4129 domain-containing protein [Actinacidiphila glaucinigra]|uniref:Protein-glutamine gamma-glutamyltransferase-like C-terminal domain-containing protein n=1 Tax=Actinacidiphila glaucinigra TaxID=235986 RepID=A0A239NI71_9ACTN|nr:DUF4129 domain-containing protein [Actinacidiphila glaucinigra]SNT54575.1 protein of unknown function [Actinacidiphila glaucinigra]
MPVSGEDVPVTIPRGPAREAAEDELSKGIYHRDDPSLLERALNWLWEKFDHLMDTASGATPGGTAGLVTIVVVVVLLVIALRLRLGKLRAQPTTGTGLFADAPRTAAEHRATAEEHARHSRWSEAVRERMRAIVRSLEERTLLDPRPGRTADEAAAEAGRALPGLAARLADAARTFDDVTYGDRPGTPGAYAALRELDTEVQRAKPRLTESGTAAPGGSRP